MRIEDGEYTLVQTNNTIPKWELIINLYLKPGYQNISITAGGYSLCDADRFEGIDKKWSKWSYNWTSSFGRPTTEDNIHLFSLALEILLDLVHPCSWETFLTNPVYYLDKQWNLDFVMKKKDIDLDSASVSIPVRSTKVRGRSID